MLPKKQNPRICGFLLVVWSCPQHLHIYPNPFWFQKLISLPKLKIIFFDQVSPCGSPTHASSFSNDFIINSPFIYPYPPLGYTLTRVLRPTFFLVQCDMAKCMDLFWLRGNMGNCICYRCIAFNWRGTENKTLVYKCVFFMYFFPAPYSLAASSRVLI